jgi:hypothetical protein
MSIADLLAPWHVADLAGPHIRIEKIGPLFGHVNSKNGTPGMPQEDDLVLVKMTPQKLGDLDAILCHASNRHCVGYRPTGPLQRLAGAALVPLDYGELFLPWNEERGQRDPCCAGAAVKT